MKFTFLVAIGSFIVSVYSKGVIPIESISQFYDIVDNDKDAYTLVKYFATWCSHCKRLKPIYAKLSESYEDNDVNFVEVDCDKFGNVLCTDIPGFPMVQLIKPTNGVTQQEEIEESRKSTWGKIKSKFSGNQNKEDVIEADRIVTYEGSRDVESYKSFITTVKYNSELSKIMEKIMNEDYECGTSEVECQEGKKYLDENELVKDFSTLDINLSNTAQERSRLENIIRNADMNDEEVKEKVKILRFYTRLLNYIEDLAQNQTQEHDEL
ncbi:hypothetical protein KAFR_0C01315 [Kazachstania africana CBS 2517]|uniref:Thioredoxin domain-containing protein n=1 Tax=Kazachstania africana (strain ATCC 22294 / BCRC 22015 / CBS 2517 / CECT 1963 / NBRC 1671 / NRRL Y-8276) TaxID=1071382 RepID=H2ARX5_KAZAF|nr:hypothetical protein KAFR_0C01315 [Kazachstania africana CBS 2517]CCF57125.1 hypothetical protein KAFR_0C01315 [Kazachstania africana CBS 2517]